MKRLAAYASVIAAIMGWAQAALASPELPRVVVTLAPIQAYADAILKGVAVSSNLLNPAQDPHTSGLSPDQALALDRADILIIPDRDMNPELARILASKKNLRVIELSLLPGAEPLPYVTDNPWLEAATQKEKAAAPKENPLFPIATAYGTPKETAAPTPTHDAEVDPHLWLDPERMAAIASPLAQAIAEFSPGHRVTLLHNAELLSTHLRAEVMPGLEALLKPAVHNAATGTKPTLPFITYHAAYQYFEARFNLPRTGHITDRPQDYLGAKTIDAIMETAQNTHITCIIGESQTALVRRVAAESGARFVFLSAEERVEPRDVPPLDWIQNDYDRLMYKTAKNFGACL